MPAEQAPLSSLVTPPPDADWATIDWTAHNEGPEQFSVRQGRGAVAEAAREDTSFRPPAESFVAAITCGLLLGFIGVFSDACSHWVNAFRMGICAHFFWLGPGMCCVDNHECGEYYTWGEFFLGRDNPAIRFVDLIMYVTFSTIAAVTASFLCRVYAPYAVGGGIAEVKTIVSGHHVKRYLGGWTCLTKLIGMCFSTGSGLVLGKEGPFVHIGACVGGILSSIFPSYTLEYKRRELITAGAGAGMAVAFGAPVGGVIFALEEVSTTYNFKTLMSTLIAGLTAVLLQSHVDLWHTGRIVQFSVNYQHNWNFFELPLFALIGIFGGFVGSAFNVANLHVNRWRKAHLKRWRIAEVAVIAIITGVVNFLTPYGSGSLLELLGDCFQDCTPGSTIEFCNQKDLVAFLYLLVTAVAKLLLFVLTIGTYLPAGILVPSLAIGALFGRGFGMMLRSLQETYSTLYVFAECFDQDICIVPGVYAIVGAAALLTGVTRMTICLAIIMFELTGSLEYMVPVIISILCAKAAGEGIGVSGNYEMGIEENKLPYLDPKKEFRLQFVAEDVYRGKRFTVLTASGLTVGDINTLVQNMNVSGFPVVESREDVTLLGYVRMKTLVRAIRVAAAGNTNITATTPVHFKHLPSPRRGGDTTAVDLTDILECSMLQVEPECAVGKLLYLFKSLGSHHIMVCRYAKFIGFISKKDLITFMRVKEKEEHMEDAELERERHELRRKQRQKRVEKEP